MMVPSQIFIIPQYLMVGRLGLLNTSFGLLFPDCYSVWNLSASSGLYGLPASLEEAARLDGCNIGQAFLYVMAPLTKSSMVALGIFHRIVCF